MSDVIDVIYVNFKHIPVNRIISLEEERNIDLIKYRDGSYGMYSNDRYQSGFMEQERGDMLIVTVETGYEPIIYRFFNEDASEFVRQYYKSVHIYT